jgi:hypothetical protein
MVVCQSQGLFSTTAVWQRTTFTLDQTTFLEKESVFNSKPAREICLEIAQELRLWVSYGTSPPGETGLTCRSDIAQLNNDGALIVRAEI